MKNAYFNDNIMDFYINYLNNIINKPKKSRVNLTPQNHRECSPVQDEQSSKVSVFSTFFYSSLVNKKKASTDDFLKLIEKKQKLLNNEIVIFPINLSKEQHWVVCCLVRGLRNDTHSYQALLYLDSLQDIVQKDSK